jgi:hypothetical protein
MKHIGIVVFLLSIWWAYIWRHDLAEGKIMRPIGWIGAGIGFYLFFEGLKCEIISALRNNKEPSQTLDFCVKKED